MDDSIFICKHCGKPYKPKRKGRNTFCSRDCSFAHQKQQKEERLRQEQEANVRQCVMCGEAFIAKNGKHCCSDECDKAKARVAARAYAEKAHTNNLTNRACKCCGIIFAPAYGVKRRAFCSHVCARKYLKKTHGSGNRSDQNRRRRAREKATQVDLFKADEIYERDNWICQICGKRVSATLRYPNQMSASLDHIIPLSLGGTHTKDNTQLAHFKCNTAKGIKGLDQLRIC